MPESEMSAAAETATDSSSRLPCRGCIRDCRYFNVCEGKLWAMGRVTVTAAEVAKDDQLADNTKVGEAL